MKTWQKIAAVVLPPIVIVGVGILYIHHKRSQPSVAPQPRYQEGTLSQDQMVQPRKLFIDDLKSAKDLIGKPVWIQAGYELDYYPFAGHRVDFAKKAGVLPSVEKLNIKDIVTQKVPAGVPLRVPRGNEVAFAVFTMGNDPKEYATAIGTIQGSDSTYYCDNIFYYDDPPQMYNFWPAKVWQAIDQHHPIQGMNELQVAMALGVMQQSDSSNYGNRTVRYNAGGQHWSVTFENDKATAVQGPSAKAPTGAA